MEELFITAYFIVLAGLSFFGGYKYGHKYGHKEGYDTGYDTARRLSEILRDQDHQEIQDYVNNLGRVVHNVTPKKDMLN